MEKASTSEVLLETAHGDRFLEEIYKLIKSQHVLAPSNEVAVADFVEPEILLDTLNLGLTKTVANVEELVALCKSVIKYSVQTNSTKFYNHGGVDVYGMAASWLAGALNTNLYNFEVAPVFTLIEQIMIDELKELVEYPITADGFFTSGASMSNMYALALARHRISPLIYKHGWYGYKPLTVFVSSDADDSILKASNWMGIGINNVVAIQTDTMGRMSPEHLAKEIIHCYERKHVPLFVNVTLGTNILGAFDPIYQIAPVCELHNVWLHADAGYGGSLLMSKIYSSRFRMLYKADSFSWSPHKTLGVPFHCSVFLTRHKQLLTEANTSSVKPLLPEKKHYDSSYDLADKTIECGRKVDAFKLWVIWKARGRLGLEKIVKKTVENSRYFVRLLQTSPLFCLAQIAFDCTNICFWFVPKRLADLKPISNMTEWWNEIDKVTVLVQEEIVKIGTLMLPYVSLASRPNAPARFFRVVIPCFPERTHADFDNIIEEFKKFEDL